MGRSRCFSIGTLAGAALLTALAAGGCKLDLGDAPFKCRASGTRCPPDYVCKENYCVRPGSCPPVLKACRDGGPGRDGDIGTADQGEAGVKPDIDLVQCGNGVCDSGETPANCPVDCPSGACGNNVCDPGEDSSTCPQDCKSQCGNGVCDPGEDSTSCPQDCQPSCTAGETRCKDSNTLETCTSGSWSAQTCQSVCAARGAGYTTGCQTGTGGKDDCFCGGTYGEPCGTANPCGSGLTCVQFMSGGFCTQTCADNLKECTAGKPAPTGTKAFCVLPYNGQNYCAFLCKSSAGSWSCPSGLTCAASDNPPGSGQYVCEP